MPYLPCGTAGNALSESDFKPATNCGAGASSGCFKGIGFGYIWPEVVISGCNIPKVPGRSGMEFFFGNHTRMPEKLSKSLLINNR